MPAVRSFSSAEAPSGALDDIRALLEGSFEGDFSRDDWAHAVGGVHVVVLEAGTLVAHAAVIARTLHVAERPLHAGYVEGVATHPDFRGRGFGSLAMEELGTLVRNRFQIGALSTDRHAFYERLGWERWRGASYVREGNGLVRTADEDEGLMVMRFGPSATVDLASSIACEPRPGDDW